jgi:diguanylate cyclase (GGDEF)-like protein
VREEQLLAVATHDDVLVSWKFLRPVLARAERDSVTGLVSRSAFLRSFDCEIARARRGDKSLSAILIDIDRFKHVNDQAGHAMGDAVLSMVGAAILTSVRSYDVAARFAGDEFVAVCCECGPDQVHIPINRIQHAVALLPAPPDATVAPVTLSIGAASLECVDEQVSAELLLEAADECLYHAKRNGRNCAFAVNLSEDAATGRQPRLVEYGEAPAEALKTAVPHGWSGRRRD